MSTELLPSPKFIDYTMISSLLACPRKFFFRHVLDLVPIGAASHHLVFGLAWHSALEAGYEEIKNGTININAICVTSQNAFTRSWNEHKGNEFDSDAIFPKNLGIGLDMIPNYWNGYGLADMRLNVIGTEMPFYIDLPGGLPQYIGRLDAVLAHDDQFQVFEHKTTSRLNSATLASYENSLQVEGYLTAINRFFDKLPLVILNFAVIQKSKQEFARHHVSRTASALDRFLAEIRFHVEEILDHLERTKIHLHCYGPDESAILTAFPRRPGTSCSAFFRPCEYLYQCLARHNPLSWLTTPPFGFVRSKWDPHAMLKQGGIHAD